MPPDGRLFAIISPQDEEAEKQVWVMLEELAGIINPTREKEAQVRSVHVVHEGEKCT